ncbi:hypothetical protein CIHG_03225 [Coccidioides immitis H538.4]|uniref:Uncharacterized protein n=1 Tax=Coccidioides immitis H538.4 TaxID=396776 RepID=A0A0J8RN76_COCIT|nr:hypothetical protein CIHG_03225 [Coccidioides immitis H538.4]
MLKANQKQLQVMSTSRNERAIAAALYPTRSTISTKNHRRLLGGDETPNWPCPRSILPPIDPTRREDRCLGGQRRPRFTELGVGLGYFSRDVHSLSAPGTLEEAQSLPDALIIASNLRDEMTFPPFPTCIMESMDRAKDRSTRLISGRLSPRATLRARLASCWDLSAPPSIYSASSTRESLASRALQSSGG